MLDLQSTRNNHWSVFLGHLMLEKLLKALYVKKKGEFPPMVNDLRRICEKAGINPDSDMVIMFDSISRFNINARYDDYKQSFYKLCSDSFTSEWIEKIKNCRSCIKAKF
ncbi:MAG: HEPN domain-containing protein [Bacteroidetes bacterium]|nr:HEPN domain-containing protein [Bacteroidota bacterium]